MSLAARAAAAGEISRGRAVLLLCLCVVFFGASWPVMKIGLVDATPLWYGVGRVGLTALAGFAIVAIAGPLRLPTRQDLPAILAVGIGQLGLFIAFANLGLEFVGAGRGAILAYTTSIWLVPLGVVVLGERVAPLRALGLVLGVAGVGLLFAPWELDWRDRNVLIGNLLLLGSALMWSLAILQARVHRWNLTPLQLLPWQALAGTIVLTLIAVLREPDGRLAGSARAWLCLVFLGIVAGPIGTWAATSMSRALPTTVSSLAFLAVPAFGMALSATLLEERVSLTLLAGCLLVLGGIVLVILSRRRPTSGD